MIKEHSRSAGMYIKSLQYFWGFLQVLPTSFVSFPYIMSVVFLSCYINLSQPRTHATFLVVQEHTIHGTSIGVMDKSRV